MGCGASHPRTVTITGTECKVHAGDQYLSLAHLKGGLPAEYLVTPPKFRVHVRPPDGQFATLDALGANEAIDPDIMDTYDALAAATQMKLTNPATGLPFKATDFTPGTIVTLPNAKLEVLAMDSFTEQYLSGHFKRGTNLKQVFEKLRVKIKETRVNLHDVYLMIDTDRNGRVDQKEFMLLIDRGVGMGILSPDEVLVLFRKFDVDGTGSISWQNFVESIDNPDAWGATPSLTDMDPTEVDKYVSGLWASSESDKEQLKLERANKFQGVNLYVKNIDDSAPQGSSGKKKPPGGPLEWRQMPELRGVGGVERKADKNVAATTYEVGRYRVGEQCTHAASAQFRNSKRLTITFMNNRFGGRMPPLVLVTVHKPRTDQAWDHAYNANVIDVTPNGFVVEVSRLDKDAGWCYELDLLWMAYGFATGDEQAIGRDPEPYEPM